MKPFHLNRSKRRVAAAVLSVALALPALAGAASPDVVISQVYGGGGNSGATYKNDFIELFNRGPVPVSLNGWSVQYASSTGTSWTNRTNLPNVTLQPGQYFLVQEAAGTGGTVNLPTPDATGTINLSGTAGKVALVNSQTALACGASCAGTAGVVDFVGFGTGTTNYEGTGPTPALSNTTAALRTSSCVDTDNNAADFSAATPNPRNTASPLAACVTPVNGACGTDSGATLAALAPTNLCAAGTPSAVTGVGHPWSWSCAGIAGGNSATCSATIKSYLLSFQTDGNGTLTGSTAQNVDFGAYATPVSASGNGGFSLQNWTGTNGFVTSTANPLTVGPVFATQTITANFSALPVSGACGADNGQTLAASAPTSLCSVGVASAVSGSGHPWSWSCGGLNGGNTAACSAQIQSYTVTFSAGSNGSITGAASQTVDYDGATTPVEAVPSGANIFSSWTGTNGFGTVADNPLVVSHVTKNLDLTANFTGLLTIYHVNDTHARVTPHQMLVPGHSNDPARFETVGGAAYLAGKLLEETAANPEALVIDAGDISEGNPIGDMGGNGSMTQFYTLLSAKLKAQRGRGMDAVVVGNHDVRDVNYIANMMSLKNTGVPVISANVCAKGTQTPYFAPYTIVNVHGKKVGLLGYTTQAAEVGASLADTLDIVNCDWNSTDGSKIHLASYVNTLRNVEKCDLVVLVAHIGHSALVDPTAPLLKDDGAAKLPEVVVTGHWHTWAESGAWQPEMLNYKSIFTEAGSYMKYLGELKVTDNGTFVSAYNHVIRDAEITPDRDVQKLIDNLTAQYDALHPGHPASEVIGYTGDDLMLDNVMKWWSADEYPWSGNNTAGQWICDAVRWKAEQLFGQCDLSIEAGGGVRADIPAGPVTYTQIYETFPWSDDTFTRVNMTGQEIVNFIKINNMDAGFSSALTVKAVDGVPTEVKFNGQPIDLNHSYTVAISNYMYNHPAANWTWSDTAPLTSNYLCREGIVDFMRQFSAGNPYRVGGARYDLNTEYSGGYRAVVTMMNDNDSKTTFEDAFVRFLSANPETLARRGTTKAPSDLVNADGTINPVNRLSENELYRSFLGFKTGALKPGDIIETWGKGSSYGGNPEFVDQEGIYGDGVEFKVVGHDDSLAKPVFISSIGQFWNDTYKNHYVKFLAKKSGASSVTDQNNQTITVMDATGYASKTLPGNTGDVLLISGIPTMESFGLRFRCDNAATVALPLPAKAAISSHLDPVPAATTASSLTLNATATSTAGIVYLAPAADAQVASGAANSNYGASNNLYVQSATTAQSSFGNERSWLKFDLSGLAGATVTGATLQLWNWKSSGADLTLELRGADSNWTESGLTWNNQPALGSVISTPTMDSGSSNLWYNWDVTSFVQANLGTNASFVLKPQTENGPLLSTFGFDAKEYGSNAPVLMVTTQTPSAGVANVKFFYRYSGDNTSWGPWTLIGAPATAAPYSVNFDYPAGYGYYEFYAVATDNGNNSETAPAAPQAATHYTPTPAYYPIVSITEGHAVFDGSAKKVSVATIPDGVASAVTYNGSATEPTGAGVYQVAATASFGGNTVTNDSTLVIAKAPASVNLEKTSFNYDGTPHPVLVDTTPAGLPVTVTYNGSATAPSAVGSYEVYAMVNDPNYHGAALGTLTIAKAAPLDISASVSVTSTGFLFSRATGKYTGSIIVGNTSAAPIAGKIDVALNNLTPGVTLANASGTLSGAPYVSQTAALNPGASITIPVQFTNPANAKITFVPVTYQE
ncbi:CBM96 family carbohydrate-binding protein [Geomesophilobacter sediminis]|uniref:DNRLRE domain-containing protein n=1 Tax=Geomesophilobacter sediminis TaxID=2798584 RepID=A0A8J7J684_9BACT|nr:MBG domain-containing protein [Geomesophilobacter sediminis]MBJ6724226.1 DNRLRE domain-containing protein [Geomesophilobacter sediminis]